MNRKSLKEKIKEEQKVIASKIKRCRPLRKPHVFEASEFKNECHSWTVEQLSYEFRHRHIVYCNMFNNTPYELIEKPRENNKPNSIVLNKIRREWEEQLDDEEVIRRSA